MTPAIDETWGYGPSELYRDRWAIIRQHLTKSQFVLVDWGSDAGWFSVKIAHDFPDATVISVEAGIMTSGRGLKVHEEKLSNYEISNNLIVKRLFCADTFDELHRIPSDYQLVLSVFHHIGDGIGRELDDIEKWDTALCRLVNGSGVTFLEIPNEDHGDETPRRIRAWYSGRDVEVVVREALSRGGVGASVEIIGETEHGSKGVRRLFKITLDSPVTPASGKDIAEHIDTVGRGLKVRPIRRLRGLVYRVLQRLGVK